ncbi:MAG: DUF421 domain-containing protein [Chloroflexota bacterium]
MDAVLRGMAIYVFRFPVFRVAGKRTLAQVTTFDFVLLLIVGEATQQALLGQDYSLANAGLLIITVVGIDIGLSLWKQRSKSIERLVDWIPLVLVEDGKLLKDRLANARVDESDILQAARELQGSERMEQIKYAVL